MNTDLYPLVSFTVEETTAPTPFFRRWKNKRAALTIRGVWATAFVIVATVKLAVYLLTGAVVGSIIFLRSIL